jgi:hypothetical protein
MHESELATLVRCSDCGSEVRPSVDRGFVAEPDTVLCYDCAERRGGAWDEERGIWSGAPDMIGLHQRDPSER